MTAKLQFADGRTKEYPCRECPSPKFMVNEPNPERRVSYLRPNDIAFFIDEWGNYVPAVNGKPCPMFITRKFSLSFVEDATAFYTEDAP
jgi:hypothetical protein